jgi:hypothetical protein
VAVSAESINPGMQFRTVKGDKIEASYVWVDASHWYKPNPKPLEKWAKGEQKK